MEKAVKALFDSIQVAIGELYGELVEVDDTLKHKRDTKARSLLLQHIQKLEDLGKVIDDLRQELEQFLSKLDIERKTSPVDENEKPTIPKTPKGKKTPAEEYILPILVALEYHGGRAASSIVVKEVGKLMDNVLNEIDLQPLKSKPHEVRWKNTARWTRNLMVHQLGYLKPDSPHGIWEISDQGCRYLHERGGQNKS